MINQMYVFGKFEYLKVGSGGYLNEFVIERGNICILDSVKSRKILVMDYIKDLNRSE